MPDAQAAVKAGEYLEECMKNQDSAGGVIECRITGTPAGLGEPVFDKLSALLAHALMSIGAVKAVEIGDGIAVTSSNGSTDNDGFTVKDGEIIKTSNHAGGSWEESVTAVKSYFVPISNQPHPSASRSRP